MEKVIKVNDIMNKKLITLHPKDKISQAEEIFKTYKIHHIPIVVSSQLVGILSMGDIFYSRKQKSINADKFLNNVDIALMTVEEIMTHNPYCIGPEASITDALNTLESKRVNALPVVEDEKLVGLITTYDLLKLLKLKLNKNHD